jgi:hypothetical protein
MRRRSRQSVRRPQTHLSRPCGERPFVEIFGAVAQLVRVPDCRSGGCGFEPRRRRFLSGKGLGQADKSPKRHARKSCPSSAFSTRYFAPFGRTAFGETRRASPNVNAIRSRFTRSATRLGTSKSARAQHRLAADSRDAPIWRPVDVKRFDTSTSLKSRQTIRLAMAKLAKASAKRKASGCLP